jgi:ubiquinone/menaquinone biosynthesis C-methylase UbiE
LQYIRRMMRESVTNFYNRKGWQFINGVSHDAQINENMTEVASQYVKKIRLRIRDHIGEGKVLLDIGCGPIQYPEYVAYSENFTKRVCVDLSKEALEIAKTKIGGPAEFIEGDYLNLATLQDSPFDDATLINVLYHVDKDSQSVLVNKILDDLKDQGALVIIYSNPKSFSSRLTQLLMRTRNVIRNKNLKHQNRIFENPIYFYRHSLSFWKNFQSSAKVEIFAWRTFSPQLEKILFRKYFFGKLLLDLLFHLEQLKFWARISEYQLIVLTKL